MTAVSCDGGADGIVVVGNAHKAKVKK